MDDLIVARMCDQIFKFNQDITKMIRNHIVSGIKYEKDERGYTYAVKPNGTRYLYSTPDTDHLNGWIV